MQESFFLATLWKVVQGIPMTLFLAVASISLGTVGGAFLALARLSSVRWLRSLSWGYVQVIRSCPLLVLLFLVYSGLSQFEAVRDSVLWPILKQPIWCALIAFTLCEAAYTSEIIRGGLQSVSRGQIEASLAFGMNRWTRFRRVVAPQAILQALPAYTSTTVQVVKATSLASLVTIMEVTGLGSSIADETFRQVEVFLITALVYLVLNSFLIKLFQWLEMQFSLHNRVTAVKAGALAGKLR